jgi:hypothetical protein
MNLTKEVGKANTSSQYLRIANFIGDDPTLFSELTSIFLTGSWRMNQRSAKPLILCVERKPDLIKPHLSALLSTLTKPDVHNAVLRNTLRLLQDAEIPKALQGKATSICFDFLIDKKTPIAIKVFAMTVLSNLAIQLPEIKNELLLHIEDQLPFGSAGFVSRGRKIIRKLKNLS